MRTVQADTMCSRCSGPVKAWVPPDGAQGLNPDEVNAELARQAVNKSAACAIPCVACFVFAAKRLDKFIEPCALPCEVGIRTVATDVRRVMPQGDWRRWPVCKDWKYPDFKAFVFNLVPHGCLHPEFEGIVACNSRPTMVSSGSGACTSATAGRTCDKPR